MKSLLLVYERTLSSKSGSVIGATVVISLRSMGIIQNLANHKMAKLHKLQTWYQVQAKGTRVPAVLVYLQVQLSFHYTIYLLNLPPLKQTKTPPTLPTPPTPPATVSPPHHALLGKP